MPIAVVLRAGTVSTLARRSAAPLASSLLIGAMILLPPSSAPLGAQARHHAKASPKAKTRSTAKARATRAAKPTRATREQVTRPQLATRPESTYFGFQVDTLAEPNPATFVPRYPPALRAQRVGGTVVVQFVVDTVGRPDMRTFKVVSSSDSAFTTAVRAAVARTDFYPALLDGRKVRQLYEQPFTFAVDSVSRAGRSGAPATPPAPATGGVGTPP